ncbi:MAG: peptidylprolyl isomerase [Planctomycetota bacterium]|jgi:parvulin-like peptidyl-prolyl isomerase
MLYVNGEKVESSLIDAEIERMRPQYCEMFSDQPEDEQNQQLSDWSRENVIEGVLFRQCAAEAFPNISDDQVQGALDGLIQNEDEMGPIHQQLAAGQEAVTDLHKQIAAQLQQEKLSRQLTEKIPAPTEKDIQRFYDENVHTRFTVPEMVRAAHIVKHPGPENTLEQIQSQMQEILEKLNAGTPFEELVSQHSDCPDQAGDLGFFARGQMVQRFEDVVFSLEPGIYSDIFETEFGLHIAKVHEKRDATPCSLEQVREVIVKEFKQQAGEKAIEQFLDAQKEKALIEER